MRGRAWRAATLGVVVLTTAVSTTPPTSVVEAAPPALLLEQRLTADEPEVFGGYGGQIALDGDLLAVTESSYSRRAIHIFRREGSVWRAERTINDVGSLDLDGTTLAVGSPSTAGGEVRIYELSTPAAPPTVLTDPITGFGRTLALAGDRLIVGSDADPWEPDRYVVVYERSGSTWARTGVLRPDRTTHTFGHAVDIEGDIAVVPEWHDAFVYRRSTTGDWTLEQVIPSPNGEVFDYESGAQVSAGTIAIAVRYSDQVFLLRSQPPSNTWSIVQTILVPGDLQEISLDDSDLMGLDWTGPTDPPLVHQYRKEGDIWVAGPVATLSEEYWYNYPGPVIDVSGDRAAVGCVSCVYYRGAAYVLSRIGTPIGPPAPPTSVSAHPIRGSAAARVRWSPPDDTGGAPIDRYIVTPDGSPPVYVPAPATSVVVTDLGEYETYKFRVVAENRVGVSPPSAPSAAVRMSGPPAVSSPYTLRDRSGDVDDPRMDIIRVRLEHTGPMSTMRVFTVRPVDPLRNQLFRVSGLGARIRVDFSPPAERRTLLVQHKDSSPVRIPGESMVGRFRYRSCHGQLFRVRVVDGAYQVTIPARCVGNPDAMRFTPRFSARAARDDGSSMSPPVRRPHGSSGNTAITSVVVNGGRPVHVGAKRTDFTVAVTARDNSGIARVVASPFSERSGTRPIVRLGSRCQHVNDKTSVCTSKFRASRRWLRNVDAGRWGVYVEATARDRDIGMRKDAKRFGLKRSTHLTANARSESTRNGARVTITGKLSAASWNLDKLQGLGHKEVQLQFRTAGARKWTTVKTVTTSGFGSLATAVTTKTSGKWRYHFPGGISISATVSTADFVLVR